MVILFFGDIFGRPGRDAVKKLLPTLIEEHKPDFVIANVENIAHGSGVTARTLEELDELGIFHSYTSGNHILDAPEAEELLASNKLSLLRPLNYPAHIPGRGAVVVTSGAKRLLVINAIGRIFMKEEVNDPFSSVMQILQNYSFGSQGEAGERVDGILVDFHAEATAEKRAFGFYLDGHVSAVVGTHTHVPTRDEQILPKGTAYISDVGMVGPFHSSLGLDIDLIIEQFLSNTKIRKEVSNVPIVEVGAVLIEIGKNGFAKNIKHIRQFVELS